MARGAVNYKLRDWLFSRQHFWGEPFPILHEIDAEGSLPGDCAAVPPEELPVDLPELAKYESHGSPDPPLEQAPADWLYVTSTASATSAKPTRMPQWAGSCWYYLRFLDPKNTQAFIDPEIERAWMPVDLYIGGAEHAVLHLLYARFWHKVLFDRGLVSTPEPFHKLVNQGMILGEMEITGYQRPDGSWVSAGDGRRHRRPAGACSAGASRETRRRLRAGRPARNQAGKPGPQNVEIPRQRGQSRTRWSKNSAPIRCGFTKCSWARWKPPSPGARTASAACGAFWTGSGG